MLIQDHIQTAFEFLDAADREFAAGDYMQASEKLWGAASQAVIAVSRERGWPHGSHYALKQSVLRLSEEHDDPLIRLRFGVAEKFHANFYYGFMEEFQLDADRPDVRDFVHRVTGLLRGM